MERIDRNEYDTQLKQALELQREKDKLVELELVKLPRPKKGRGKANVHQLMTILEDDPRFTGRLRFNEAKGKLLLDGEELTEQAITALCKEVHKLYRFSSVSSRLMRDAAVLVARDNPFNPVVEYLDG